MSRIKDFVIDRDGIAEKPYKVDITTLDGKTHSIYKNEFDTTEDGQYIHNMGYGQYIQYSIHNEVLDIIEVHKIFMTHMISIKMYYPCEDEEVF